MSNRPHTCYDLPFHFKESLVSYLDIKSRFQLAASSKNERELIRSCSFKFYSLSIGFPTSNPETSDYCLVFEEHQKSAKAILLLDTAEITISVLSNIFSHQKSIIEEMTLCYNYSTEHYYHSMEEFTDQLNCKMIENSNLQMKTRSLVFLTDLPIPDSFTPVFSCFNSVILKKVRFTGEVSKEILEIIVATDQWKSLNNVTLQARNTTPILQLLPPNVIQFSLFRHNLTLTPYDVVRLVQKFITRNSPYGSFLQVLTSPENPFDKDATLQQLSFIAKGVDRTGEYTDVMLEMPSSDYVFVARVFGIGLQGAVCKMDNLERDKEWLLRI